MYVHRSAYSNMLKVCKTEWFLESGNQWKCVRSSKDILMYCCFWVSSCPACSAGLLHVSFWFNVILNLKMETKCFGVRLFSWHSSQTFLAVYVVSTVHLQTTFFAFAMSCRGKLFLVQWGSKGLMALPFLNEHQTKSRQLRIQDLLQIVFPSQGFMH